MSKTLKHWAIAASALAALVGIAEAAPLPQSEPVVNEVAFSLYAKLARPDHNLFFSPYSLTVALAMTAEGARGETAAQMGSAMQLDASMQRSDPDQPFDWTSLHAQLGSLADRLAPKPVPPAVRKQLSSLRAELADANTQLEQASSYGKAYYELATKAQRLAAQINQLVQTIDQYEFRSANALWFEQSFVIESAYLDTIARYYGSVGAMPVDFREAPEPSRVTINQWVSTQTRQRIAELIAPGMIDESTRLVLTNAVYFLGEWAQPFDATATRSEPFHHRDGSTSTTSLMHARRWPGIRYAAFQSDGASFSTPLQISADDADEDDASRYPSAGFQIIEMPYKGDELSMLVLLPMQHDGLPALEALLSAEHLDQWSRALVARGVDISLPRWRQETSYELSSALQQLGMQRAFVNPADAKRGAQFDGISASSDPEQRLYIGAVAHKAFVEVNEKGTEAAAATAVMMAAGAAMPTMVDFMPKFRADRPFVYLIRDNQTGTILFIGRLVAPSVQGTTE